MCVRVCVMVALKGRGVCGRTDLGDISLELPAQLQQVLVGMFALLLPTGQLRRYRVELPLQTQRVRGSTSGREKETAPG